MFNLLLALTFFSGFGNTVLRLSIESDFTLYRIIAPITFILIFFKSPKFSLKVVISFLLFFVYSFLLAINYSSNLSQFIPSVVHYAYIFMLFAALWMYRKRHLTSFEVKVWGASKVFIAFVLLFLLVEFSFGATFPNLYSLKEGGMPALRAFYWNQNDLAVVLCGFCWFLFANRNVAIFIKLAVFAVFFSVLLYNGSKSALISLILISVVSGIDFVRNKVKQGKFILFASFSFVVGLISLVFYVAGAQEFSTSQGTYTLNQIFTEPISRIFSLNATGEHWGSISNRTDASIFVIIEYIKSGGIGLGPGGAWLVLTLPQYELGGAKSPHNALLQLVVDFGYPVVFGYMYFLAKAIKAIWYKDTPIIHRIRANAILTFPLLGLSQSGAIVTNYSFIFILFFMFLSRDEYIERIFAKKK